MNIFRNHFELLWKLLKSVQVKSVMLEIFSYSQIRLILQHIRSQYDSFHRLWMTAFLCLNVLWFGTKFVVKCVPYKNIYYQTRCKWHILVHHYHKKIQFVFGWYSVPFPTRNPTKYFKFPSNIAIWIMALKFFIWLYFANAGSFQSSHKNYTSAETLPPSLTKNNKTYFMLYCCIISILSF